MTKISPFVFHNPTQTINIDWLKVLIVKLSSIGDVVHALPALAAIRKAFRDAEIGWAVDSRFVEILRDNPYVDHLIEINTRSLSGGKIAEEMLLDIGKQIGKVRKFKFDIALDMQGLLKSATLAKFSGVRKRVGFDKSSLREPTARFLYTDSVAIPSQSHVIKKNIVLAEVALGFKGGDGTPEFPIATSEEDKLAARSISENVGDDFVILNPAGGWVTKLWPAENYGELAERLWNERGLVSVIATGPNEDELAERVRSTIRNANVLFEKPTLKGFYELAKLARVYVGGDTGPTHIAIAAGTPIVGIFGPTEWWRNGSLNPDDICVERNDISCRVDCHRRTCGKWICMEISVDTVFEAVTKRIAEACKQ